jgi:hypothetical protein
MYSLFVNVYCTVLLPPAVHPVAVKCIISYIIIDAPPVREILICYESVKINAVFAKFRH